MRSRRVVIPCSKARWTAASSLRWLWRAIWEAERFFFLGIWCSFLYVSSGEPREIYERFADCGVGVVEVVKEFSETTSGEAGGTDADLDEAGDDGVYTVVDFCGGFVVSGAVDASDGLGLGFLEGSEKVAGFVKHFFLVGGRIIWNDNEETFVHNVSFLSENVDEVYVIVH